MITIREAVEADVPLILELIKALAEYERLAHEAVATEAHIQAALFGPRPYAEVLIALEDDTPTGFALFFHNFSTFVGKPGLYLEDLFVKPEFRGRGAGIALFRRLAQIALERGCGRMEWSVLDWNESSIKFYKQLGATPKDEWTIYRMTEEAIAKLADVADSRTPSR